MGKNIGIGEAEWQVMEALWTQPGTTFADIRIMLKHCSWTQTTIHTMLSRLQKKGLVTIEPGSSPYIYRPVVSRAECRVSETRSFLQKAYNGSSKLLISTFIQDADLSDKEISGLMEILKSRERGKVSNESDASNEINEGNERNKSSVSKSGKTGKGSRVNKDD